MRLSNVIILIENCNVFMKEEFLFRTPVSLQSSTATPAGTVMGSCCGGQNQSTKVYEDTLSQLPSLDGKIVAITGCTTGTGFHLAAAAARKGAKMILMLNRRSDRATSAAEKVRAISAEAGMSTLVETVECDLLTFHSVKACAEKVKAITKIVHILALNAGLNTLTDDRSVDGFEVAMQTNQISHVQLLSDLFSCLEEASKQSGDARVVFHSSGAREMYPGDLRQEFFQTSERNSLGGQNGSGIIAGARGAEGPWQRYHQSKLANAAFAMALHDKLKRAGKAEVLKSLCAEPGAASTAFLQKLVVDGLVGSTTAKMMGTTFQSAEDGTAPIMMACFSLDATSGDYYAPVKEFTGEPVKMISQGVPVKNGTQKLTVSQANKDNAWSWSLQAIGSPLLLK